MWSGRFREPLDPEFDQWQRSFSFDRRLLGDELAASAAWARSLEKAGILDSAELARIVDGLEKIGKACQANPKVMDEADAEDVHHFVELQLVKEIGETAYKLHTGRSRNEQIATDLRLFARRSVDAIRGQLAQVVAALIARAEELGSTAMPSYTHLQKAEPVLSAHWLLAYAEMFFRDADRLADCRKRVNVLPLGSGAVAGSGLKLDRAGMAKELGFAGDHGEQHGRNQRSRFRDRVAERAVDDCGSHEPVGGGDHDLFDARIRVHHAARQFKYG